jgi:transcriptional regulator with XRE-family HTH domain
MVKRRVPYRSNHRLELERIEARRIAANISLADICAKAGISVPTYYRMRRSGLAFKRHVKALAMAMRTLEGEAQRGEALFPFGGASGPGSATGSDGRNP